MPRTSLENVKPYLKLLGCNVDLMSRYYLGNVQVLDLYNPKEPDKFLASRFVALPCLEGEKLGEFLIQNLAVSQTRFSTMVSAVVRSVSSWIWRSPLRLPSK